MEILPKIVNLTNNEKLILLNALGYDIDQEKYIIDKITKERVIDKYSKKFVKIDNASILPGSTIIIDTNAFSIAEYFEEYKD